MAEIPAGAPEDLGPLVSVHRVANRRRLGVAVRALGITALATIVAVGLLAVEDGGIMSGSGTSRVARISVMLALVGLFVTVSYGTKALRGGQNEHFQLREHGLVHVTARRTRMWEWDDLATIRIRARARPPALAVALGSHYQARITRMDGRGITITGLTEGHEALGHAIAQHCEQVGERINRRLRWVWLALTAPCVLAIVLIVNHINDHQDGRQVIDHGGYREEIYTPGLTDSTTFLLTMGIAASSLLTCVFLAMFLRTFTRK
ncbi:hypothetical protein LX15_000097 [Streptoalloteichus tenebrarius]|uniref:PH domain-containing protein n=1 Tax=Streptoalloteichus tenebrarius (strain ATCC 17920 / DSM 40477 / JCM 4838 / CBS 697.72 / NBRC 16177 / NCIMB 11028 / NRRL B-12390 / A12253. 1 / ISP 5477) TaxID=1933 RepID=A0ABT1HLM6_STRSD|nr:hypothetical protein [Streptoalloteichus tenebrarius]MCP2256414.1 hypothetical protein [Streptoalloteichus tenebrarius]BFF04763.1 hypothetical protein GCM10020241_64380 [Streptoalloteichus tenebrarius]